MRILKFKRCFAVTLILMMLLTTTACSNGSVVGFGGSKKIDVILWNTNGDKFPEASGVDLMTFAAKEYKNKTGIKVNLISIEADTQEDYFTKRIEVLLSKDQPEMILFNTRNQDELQVIEAMKNDLLHIDGMIENNGDVFDGMKSEQYCAFATLVYGNVMNNTVVSELGDEPNVGFMSAEDVESIYLKWAETKDAELNLFDYRIFSGLGLSSMVHFEDEKVMLEQDAIINKIKLNEAFVKALPERNLSSGDVNDFLAGVNKELYSKERDAMISTARLKPVNFLTKVAFNAFDMQDFSSNINDVQSGFVIGDYSFTASVGFGILDNQSKEQANAIDFANFLLSQEFQTDMQTYTSKSPKMSGSVLKTVNEKGVELARSQEMLSNGKPIQDSVTQAHELISERFNQPGALHFSAISNISTVAYEEIIKLSTEQIWGEAKTDVELRNALDRLEEQLNHM